MIPEIGFYKKHLFTCWHHDWPHRTCFANPSGSRSRARRSAKIASAPRPYHSHAKFVWKTSPVFIHQRCVSPVVASVLASEKFRRSSFQNSPCCSIRGHSLVDTTRILDLLLPNPLSIPKNSSISLLHRKYDHQKWICKKWLHKAVLTQWWLQSSSQYSSTWKSSFPK